MSMTTAPTPKPTQVKRPWRATLRSVLQFALGLASLLPLIAAGVYTDIDQAPVIVGQVLAVAAAITRIMAIPAVEAFLREHALVSWLAAERPILGKAAMSPLDPRPTEKGAADLLYVLVVVLVVLVILALVGVL